MLEVNFGKLIFSRFWFPFYRTQMFTLHLCNEQQNKVSILEKKHRKTTNISNFTYEFVIRPYSAFKFGGRNRRPKTKNLRFWPNISAYGIPLLWQYGLWSFQTGGTKLERFLPF